jgi:hypothetical protein
MKIVICKDDTNLPQGAHVVFDEEYEIEEEFINALDQRVYVLKNAINEGTTKMGMKWRGYRADRFRVVESDSVSEKSYEYASN